MQYDVAVIGAGVSGALIARELSRYNLRVALLEKCGDVAMGASKANSAIVHAGYDAASGTLKAKLNLRGSVIMKTVCEELNVPYKGIGSLVVAYSEPEKETLNELYDRGIVNGVENMKIVDRQELRELEPAISDKAVGALVAPTAAIICPYELTIAATENAVKNGAQFIRNCEVQSISYDSGVFDLETTAGVIKSRAVVNAAGVFADKIAGMIGDNSFKIIARKGEYYLLDKSERRLVNHVLFACPTKMGKGILVTPTVDGNVLMGPTAVDVEDRDDVGTTPTGLDELRSKANLTIPAINTRSIITSFSGLRAHTDSRDNDFIIAPSEKNPAFINVAGIESPGLSAAPAIGEYVSAMVTGILKAEKKADFDPSRTAPVRFRELDDEQRKALIAKNSSYGRIVCRCETVTEGEIIDSIKGPVGATDMDGVKRRTRAGMGRCQSGFCGSKVVEVLSRELGIPVNEVTKFGGESKIIYEETK